MLIFFIQVYTNSSPTQEAHYKCKSAIQTIVRKCEDFGALEKLMTPSTPIKIMPYILLKMTKVFSDFSVNYIAILYFMRI